jgi:Tol biopolymer transport system component
VKPIRGGLLLAVTSIAAILVFPATGWATWPGANGRIAYVGIGTVRGIDSIRPDGSGHRVLTRDRDREPSWSADGRRIVFVRNNEWNAGSSFNQVFTMRADGQDQTRVTHEGKPDFSPSFSPDGRRIVYVDTGGRGVSLATIRPDGTHRDVLLRLKFSIASPGPQSVSPTYALSGRRIVFAGVVERRSGRHSEAIWSIRTDGSHLHRLTKPGQNRRECRSQCFDVFPYWAPDGHHIIFWRCSGDCDLANAPRLSIMRADGSHERQLSWRVPAGYLTPSVISPSGDLFAFANYDGDCHINCLINIAIAPTGSPAQDITHNSPDGRADVQPSWQPLPRP